MKASYYLNRSSTNIGLVIFLIGCTIFLSNCKKIQDYIRNSKPSFVVMSNGSDPLLIQYKSKDTIIEVFGIRDKNGKPLGITDFIITTRTDTAYYKFNSDRKISTIIAPNHTKFLFNWIGTNSAVVTVLSKDGVNQLTTQVDFASPLANGSPSGSILQRPSSSILRRLSTSVQLSFTPSKVVTTSLSSSNSVYINVSQCSSPSDAETYLVVKTSSNETLGIFPGQYITKGLYGVNLPSNIAPILNPGEICSDLAEVLNLACYATELPGLPLLCPAIAAAIGSSGIGTVVAAPILEACSAAIAGLELYCATFNASPSPSIKSLVERICASPFINRAIIRDVILIAFATGLPNNVYSFSEVAPGNGPYPSLNILLGSATTIRKLELAPPAPIAGQSYVANVDVFCLSQGSTIKISVVGTDGYTNSITYSITSTTSNGVFTLTVPGAATAGISDVVTLQITLPNGTVLTRIATLVFR